MIPETPELDEALDESFPASDPPAMTASSVATLADETESVGAEMLRLFRIVSADELDRAFAASPDSPGTRWTSHGTLAVVAALTAEGALLETLAHIEGRSPEDLQLVVARVPASSIAEPGTPPQNWDQLPYRSEVQAWGDSLLRDGDALGYRVPSALVPAAHNVLLRGERAGELAVESHWTVAIDERLRI